MTHPYQLPPFIQSIVVAAIASSCLTLDIFVPKRSIFLQCCCMRFFDIVQVALVVSGRLDTKQKPAVVTWLIDGTNLQCCSSRGRKDRQHVISEIEKIASSSHRMKGDDADKSDVVACPVCNVVLVFDGNHDESFEKIVRNRWFQIVITDGKDKRKDRADDYIVNHALPELQDRFGIERVPLSSKFVVHLVSADRTLRKRASATRLMYGGSTVDPPKFWKDYLPNLQQQKLKTEGRILVE